MGNIIYSALQTPDGTILESRHRHDYRTYVDKNGKQYMIDGGNDYIRHTIHGDEKLITLYDDSPFEQIREHFTWGRSLDKDKNFLPKTEWIKLKEITDDHLEALCVYKSINDVTRLLFLKEKQYRNLDLEGI